ncbi:yjbG polysaccharide synthesis-related protein [Vibrio ishigakensis]|uniref:YjbG polysaccharide synthesis-related protein n=1 Tax=Vibrio ishigakensis TaxID=1481914 RepID=A0A0B8PE65_9VIBR|nr:yjbG polysaccharide synthesis-related protein [Vibrio ishigakensis]
MGRFLSWMISLVVSTHLCSAELIVELPLQNKALKYAEKTRLSQVLIDVHNVVPERYSLGLFLADPSKQAEVDELFQEIESELVQRKNKPNYTSLNQASQTILEQLTSFQFKSRMLLELDYDLARARPMSDPMLSYQGQSKFEVYAFPRPEYITLVGAIDRPGKLTFKPHFQLADYLDEHGIVLLDGANKTQAIAIQPDGKVVEMGFGWWNSKETYLAPGAIVFVVLNSLWNENEELNRQITELLVHRVGL